MNMKHFTYFLAAYRYQNMALAAEELYISRQALSKTIREMESELNKQLFIRSKNGLKPTDDAIELAKYARNIIENYNLIAGKDPLAELAEKEITVYTFDGVADYLSADFFSAFIESYPDYLLNIVESTDKQARDMLLLGECDFAIVPDSVEVGKFERVLLFKALYGVLIHIDNDLSRKWIISLKDLQTQRVIGKNRGLAYYSIDTNTLIEGKKIDFIAEISNNRIAYELVEKNLGIALAWNYLGSNVNEPAGKVVFRQLIREGWGRNVYLLLSPQKRDEKKTAAFKEFLIRWVQNR